MTDNGNTNADVLNRYPIHNKEIYKFRNYEDKGEEEDNENNEEEKEKIIKEYMKEEKRQSYMNITMLR